MTLQLRRALTSHATQTLASADHEWLSRGATPTERLPAVAFGKVSRDQRDGARSSYTCGLRDAEFRTRCSAEEKLHSHRRVKSRIGAELLNVGVIGLGYVGSAVVELFQSSGHRVIGWDVRSEADYPHEEFGRVDFFVVCVDTPPDSDGLCDTAQVHAAISCLPNKLILLKSTVPPGTTDNIQSIYGVRVVHWPEFISQSSYFNPFFSKSILEIPFVILGGDEAPRRQAIDFLIRILGPTKTYFQCTARESEFTKYMSNAYFALKVSFAAEMRGAAECLGCDWHTVREGWTLDPRVERMHTAVFAESPGIGGQCLPKDLSAFTNFAHAAGAATALLDALAVQCLHSPSNLERTREPVRMGFPSDE